MVWENVVTDSVSYREKWSKRVLKVDVSPVSMLQIDF